ncbi:hypothetical protein FNV43_RR12912 [Rhamnella rubrinervis]|uniref:Uncharacterized protein n=1 Tax=Rhamnella rubrinervis TaxID=2594499 RepID=A0A8K0H057_9ROSA|nr:hypothetical protein FNV43_RR12912 [Rhamnella rubrinervis]
MATLIVSSLMTRNDQVDFSMSYEKICQEAKQNALKLCKKKVVYRKGVEDTFLHARKEMICRFKVGETNWPTLESSEDEGDDEPSESSSGEDEHEGDAGGEQNIDNLPKDPPPAPERTASPTRNSFIEAIQPVRSERIGPSTNTKEVTTASQPNQ